MFACKATTQMHATITRHHAVMQPSETPSQQRVVLTDATCTELRVSALFWIVI